MVRTVNGDISPDFGEVLQSLRSLEDHGYSLAAASGSGRSQPLTSLPLHLGHIPRCPRTALQSFSYILPQPFELHCSQLVLRFHHSQSFANDFAGGIVEARGDLLSNEFLQLRSEVDIHGHGRSPRLAALERSLMAMIVKD